MRSLFVVVSLFLGSAAHAADACDTLAGWSNEACKADAASATKVLALASTRLGELGDCSTLKKKELLACAAEVSRLANTAVGAGQVLASMKPKITRANDGRMEAGDTDE